MHYLRPLYVVLVLAGIILIVRSIIVPRDFGIHDTGYTYGWYRKANIEDWKSVTVKFQGREYCSACHAAQFQQISASPHRIIQCENCHGPAMQHPSEPAKLRVDRTRELCLRCHSSLPYPTSERAGIAGINPDAHNSGIECASCHNPHEASKPR
jgi:predicted CXXCH cytochrome family protein